MKYEKGTFMWAVEQMNAGKKIRRSVWDSSEYINFTPGSESIYDEKKHNITICKIELTATDWELFDEKKPLSDKIFQNRLEERDVKQALKNILARAKVDSNNTNEDRECIDYEHLKRIIKEEVGKELTE